MVLLPPTPPALTGIVGKLPAHGDFIRRGGPAEVLALLDNWLNREIGAVAASGLPADEVVAALDGAFGAFCHDGKPVLAALIASGDRVGRRFPLVATLTGAPADRQAAEAWCAAATAALLSARDTGGDADATLAAVATIAPPAPAAASVSGWWRTDTATSAEDGDHHPTEADPAQPDPGSADPNAPSADPPHEDQARQIAAHDVLVGAVASLAPDAGSGQAGASASHPIAPTAPARPWWRPGRPASPARADLADDQTAPGSSVQNMAGLPTGEAFRALLVEARL